MITKTSKSALLGALCIGLLTATAARADSAQDALKRFTDGVQTFEAHFDQVQTDDKGRITGRSSGHFWLSRPAVAGTPGRFRWAYEKPYQQATICDGAKLWAFDPDLNQVTVREAKAALAGTPAELLSQKAALNTAFTVKDAGNEGDTRLVTLVPKSKDSDFKTIELALDKDGAPLRMRFADQIGGHSEVSFTEVHTNARIDPAQFQFTPPKGAEIVNDGGITTKSLD
ncbi:MAG: outer membrane lipoprotein chaperone LolA [Nevskia sp.]|nr:outer membrane lipoprotein chaperone LolA [Nevskia sp.]